MSSRVLILTASIGAGRDKPAEFLATALRERGAIADVVDGLPIAGPVARAIIGGASSPESTAGNVALDAGYLLGTRFAPSRRVGSRLIERIAGRRFGAYLREHPADAVVSTYPIWDRAAGAHARRRHALDPRRQRDHRPRGAALLGPSGGRPAPR